MAQVCCGALRRRTGHWRSGRRGRRQTTAWPGGNFLGENKIESVRLGPLSSARVSCASRGFQSLSPAVGLRRQLPRGGGVPCRSAHENINARNDNLPGEAVSWMGSDRALDCRTAGTAVGYRSPGASDWRVGGSSSSRLLRSHQSPSGRTLRGGVEYRIVG